MSKMTIGIFVALTLIAGAGQFVKFLPITSLLDLLRALLVGCFVGSIVAIGLMFIAALGWSILTGGD